MKLRKILNSRFLYLPLLLLSLVWGYSHYINKASDTFKGAFLGFLVGLFTFIFSKYFEAQARRYTSLVYLEHELNACSNDLGDNAYQIDLALKADALTLIRPIEIKITEEYIKDLGRIELKNAIFPLFIDIRKFNSSLKHAIDVFDRNVLTVKQLESVKQEEIVKALITQFHQDLRGITEFGQKINEDIIGCLVKVRFFLRNDQTLLSKDWLLQYYDKKEFQKWLIDDRKKVEAEMANSTKQDEEKRMRVKEKLNLKHPTQ